MGQMSFFDACAPTATGCTTEWEYFVVRNRHDSAAARIGYTNDSIWLGSVHLAADTTR